MAGTLPGVKVARIRRFHQRSCLNCCSGLPPSASGYGGSSTGRPSCLHSSSHDFHLCSSSSVRNPQRQILCDESSLGAEAREAKERLDERLQGQWRSDAKRTSTREGSLRSVQQYLQASEVQKWKKKSWLKGISWKSSEQEECVVCLEQLKAAAVEETLMQLQCGHKFHTNCLVPWLKEKARCPCCGMEISS